MFFPGEGDFKKGRTYKCCKYYYDSYSGKKARIKNARRKSHLGKNKADLAPRNHANSDNTLFYALSEYRPAASQLSDYRDYKERSGNHEDVSVSRNKRVKHAYIYCGSNHYKEYRREYIGYGFQLTLYGFKLIRSRKNESCCKCPNYWRKTK